jgi:hypothetical protein
MKRAISVIFRAIPLLMAGLCFAYGLYVYTGGSSSGFFIAGNVVISLAAICYALFAAGATISRQQKGTYGPLWEWLLLPSGYGVAAATVSYGLYLLASGHTGQSYAASHVVTGLGLIAACVSTVAATARHLSLIPENSHRTAADGPPPGAPGRLAGLLLTAVPLACALVAFGWAFYSLTGSGEGNFIGGLVLLGLAGICASLVALVATIDRQIRNAFGEAERFASTYVIAGFGTLNVVLGIVVLVFSSRPYAAAPGYVLIGLGLICFSIMSKAMGLALTWRRESALADRLTLIPIAACVTCLFIGAFLFEAEVTNSNFFVPARVLVGLGAICFALFAVGEG